jgi:integrase
MRCRALVIVYGEAAARSNALGSCNTVEVAPLAVFYLATLRLLSAAQAREQAKRVLGRVAIGEDPQAERRDRRGKDQLNLRSVIGEYLQAKELELRPRSFADIKRYLTGSYFRALHALPVDTITRKDIAGRLVAITRESSSNTAARFRDLLHAFFVWALQMGYVEQNPVLGTIKPKETAGRTRVLNDAELAAVWRAAGDDEHGKIVKLLILTAARRQEIGGMRWSELDEERSTWALPASRAKNNHTHTLPLPPAAWAIINSLPHLAGRDHLFGVRAERGFSSWALAKSVLDKRLGGAFAPFVLHDLRRTVATKMADLAVQPHIIEEILNHRGGHKAGIAGIYNRSSYEREVRAALLMWADYVRVLEAGGESKILPFVAS